MKRVYKTHRFYKNPSCSPLQSMPLPHIAIHSTILKFCLHTLQELLPIPKWFTVLSGMFRVSKLIQIELKFCFHLLLQRLLRLFVFEVSFIVNINQIIIRFTILMWIMENFASLFTSFEQRKTKRYKKKKNFPSSPHLP